MAQSMLWNNAVAALLVAGCGCQPSFDEQACVAVAPGVYSRETLPMESCMLGFWLDIAQPCAATDCLDGGTPECAQPDCRLYHFAGFYPHSREATGSFTSSMTVATCSGVSAAWATYNPSEWVSCVDDQLSGPGGRLRPARDASQVLCDAMRDGGLWRSTPFRDPWF